MQKNIFLLISVLLSFGAYTQNYNNPGGTINTCTGTFYDTGGSGGNYANSQNITTTFCSNSSNCVSLNFTLFDLETCCDRLYIHDGPTTASPQIPGSPFTTNPGTITSTSGCLTFRFTSDGSIVKQGWAATISCVPCPVPTCSDVIQNQGETGIDCGGPCPACPPVLIPTACSNITYNMTASTTITFYDDGGPGGNPCADAAVSTGNYCNCNCFTTVTICAAAGQYIIADFREFAMWNTTSGWDWMKIFNGPNTGSPLMYDNSASGPNNPMGDCGIGSNVLYFCSSGQCMTFQFWATSVVNRAGWDALISSVPSYCTSLPVELVDFDGVPFKNYNLLEWSTATEINNDYFIIERSDDAQNFEVVATVSGGGNSNVLLKYSYQHSNPKELEYYRLKQIDFDGKFEYSKIIAVRNNPSLNVTIYPNPSKNNLFIGLSEPTDATYTIIYTNILGSISKEQIHITEGTNTYQVNEFIKLTAGIYFVQIINENGEVIKTQKIVKE